MQAVRDGLHAMRGPRYRLRAALFLLCAVVALPPLAADEAPILTVVEANQPAPIKLSLDQIKAMGRAEIATTTPWRRRDGDRSQRLSGHHPLGCIGQRIDVDRL
jgi:hypothetical protein